MKKTIATTVLFAALALVGCNKPAEDKGPNVPVADGKTTIFFKLADDSVVPADYASVYLAGAMTGWATGLEAPAFQKDAASGVYYVQLDTPEDPETWKNTNGDTGEKSLDYQLVLGYNSTSNMPDGELGLKWNDAYKCDQTTSGTSNPTFEWDGASKTIDLGIVKFSTQVIAPAEPISNVTFVVNLSEALPDGYDVYIPGSWNGWALDATAKTTADAARKKFSLLVPSIYANTYEFQIVACATELNWDIKSAANANGNVSRAVNDNAGGTEVDILAGDTTSFTIA